jgi:hypothetical protein
MMLFVRCSGPHIGSRADSRLWEEHGPQSDMDDDEAFLADKGYVGCHGATAPVKKPVGGVLSQFDQDYNNALASVLSRSTSSSVTVCTLPQPASLCGDAPFCCVVALLCFAYGRWYRATVEHVFAQCKRFKIFGSVFRGRITLSEEFLNDMIVIVVGVITLQVGHLYALFADRKHLLCCRH